MPPHPDAIAECVLSAFHALPAKCKPRTLPDGRREWVPLAGIVLSRDALSSSSNTARNGPHGSPAPSPSLSSCSSSGADLTCAALATGMKCLPQNKLAQARGNVLHDWHAEVLAIRAFNRFLVDECADLAKKGFKSGDSGAWVRWSTQHTRDGRGADVEDPAPPTPPFELREDVSIHMYCSEAPCGDASMELVMAAQDDDTPWATPAPSDGGMLGRGNFDQLGIVRRKPARPDAPLTLSKSCSDKLAMKQCTSLLSATTSQLLWPGSAYLSSLVLPESQYVRKSVERAFGVQGRMGSVTEMGPEMRREWSRGGYSFKPFEVQTTRKEFKYSKRCSTDTVAAPSNLTTLATPRRQEILINGVLQGRKQFDAKGASCVSRKGMWKAVLDGAAAADVDDHTAELSGKTYGEMKASQRLEARERVKGDVRELALKGWQRNVGDEEWSLEDM